MLIVGSDVRPAQPLTNAVPLDPLCTPVMYITYNILAQSSKSFDLAVVSGDLDLLFMRNLT